jgi:hypothetical protein
MTISRAPIARVDYQSASLAAVFFGVVGAGVVGWLAAKIAHLPGGYLDLLFHVARHGNDVSAKAQIVFGSGPIIGIIVGATVFYFATDKKYVSVVHSEGGQVRHGAGAASKVIKEELKRSPSLFQVAGLDFTIARIRRSFLFLASPGGGKTQIIWAMLPKLQKTNYRVLLVDGPKGDYSTSTPGDLLIVAPWHSGPSWDIARDCPTRGHARELAKALIPVSEKDPLWGNAAGMIFTAILCKLQAENDVNWGWSELYEHITLDIDTLRGIAQEHYPPAVQILADAESKTTQSVAINLTAFMQDVFELALAWRDTEERFSFLDWWQDKGEHADKKLVILQGSGEFKSLAGAYISSILQLLAGLTASTSFPESATRRNIIICDEFAQLPKMPGFEKFFEIGRSKGCSAIIATQAPSQLRKIWGEDDYQSWCSMIGTKIFGQLTGFHDAQMALDELGEKEVFRRTETITSNGTGTDGSASVGWAKETIGVVRMEELAELGPQETGVTAIIKGFGKDPIQMFFPYIDTPILRPVFYENRNFNKPISSGKQTAIVNCVNATDGETFTQITDAEASQQVPTVHADNDTDERGEHLLIMQTAEPLQELDDYADFTDAQYAEDGMDEIGQDVANSGISGVIGEALDVDSHMIEFGLEIAELLDDDAGKQVGSIEVAAVVGGEKNEGKRESFKNRKKRKQAESIDIQEVQQ